MEKNEILDNPPLVSIVVVTYNSSRYVLETLESMKSQTYMNLELIISDDASVDNTVKICKAWVEENKKRFVRTELISVAENTGIPSNINRGIKAAKGEWVKPIAGDDVMMDDCIERYMEYASENPSAELLHSKVRHYNSSFTDENRLPEHDTAAMKINRPGITAKEQFEILLRGNKIWAASIFVKKSVYEKVGLFDENLRLWDDRPFLLKVTMNNIKLHFVNITSCKYRVHLNSIQRQRRKDNLITDFNLEVSKHYHNNYLKYLPRKERIIKSILLKRILFLDKFNLNKNNLGVKAFMALTAFPWNLFLRRINKKYE
ncbi:MAG: glycosyltransferase [Bacteroidota bacterium]|nr:glycosyltransferase [Bacteroidota bacterium]